MNTSRMRMLADAIEESAKREGPCRNMASEMGWKDIVDLGSKYSFTPEIFDMGAWLTNIEIENEEGPQCGTAGCIAGFTVCLFSEETNRLMEHRDLYLFDVAKRILGLDVREAEALFVPDVASIPDFYIGDIEPKEAAMCLRMVADGEPIASAWMTVMGERHAESQEA